MKIFQILLLLFFCWGCNSNPPNKELGSHKLGSDTVTDTYSVESKDVSMNTAIRTAKKTLAEFDSALKSNNPSYTDFAVKKRYRTANGGGEHMWIAGITIVNGNYMGYINNDAVNTNEVAYGDTVVVKKDEVTDWMFLENNVLRGGYTIREVRNRMSKEEQATMDEEMGFTIEN